MDNVITIFHGSDHIIEVPEYGCGKINNDFGQGFYCTEHIDLAKEWGVSEKNSGYANRYELNTSNLRILHLNSPDYSILNWIAVLLEHRVFTLQTPVARKAKQYIIENFTVNVNAYDLITGYRADDSYFDYAETFINNGITVGQLAEAMRLGGLGEQIVLKSQYAFSQLSFRGYEYADKNEFYSLRKQRNEEANKTYYRIQEQYQDGLFVQDIIRGNIGNDDPRIPRNICEQSSARTRGRF